MFNWFASKKTPSDPDELNSFDSVGGVRVLKHAKAMRVIFFYPGEEGTYVDHPTVTLFENGVVHIRAPNEETTTHLQHCEILWRFELPENAKSSSSNLRVLKLKPRENGQPESPPPH